MLGGKIFVLSTMLHFSCTCLYIFFFQCCENWLKIQHKLSSLFPRNEGRQLAQTSSPSFNGFDFCSKTVVYISSAPSHSSFLMMKSTAWSLDKHKLKLSPGGFLQECAEHGRSFLFWSRLITCSKYI